MNRPYRVVIWHGAFLTRGTYATFFEAIAAFATESDRTKAIINDDRAELGKSGLTDDELDVLFELPATRPATDAELAAALSVEVQS